MRFSTIVFAASLVVGFVAPAHGEGDAAVGAKLAREQCVRCHNIEPGGPFKLHPPSFASIAVFRSQEQILGRILYPPLHSSMSQIGYYLTPDNVDHLVAYIVSLERK